MEFTEKFLICSSETFDVVTMHQVENAPQLYSLIYGREEIGDVFGTWLAALKLPRAGEFAEAIQDLYEKAQHPFSLELFSQNQVVEYSMSCHARDREQMFSSIHLVSPNSRIHRREDYTQYVPEDAVILASDFGSLCSHVMPYLTFKQLMTDVMSPLVHILTLLPARQRCILQFVLQPYPDTAHRNFRMRLSMYHWLTVFLRNPYQWFWPGTYERHLWGNARMREHLFHANFRILLWEENQHQGDSAIEQEQLNSLELSMETINCPLRYLDMHALGICARQATHYGFAALKPFQDRALKKPFVLTSSEIATFYHPVPIQKHPQVKHFLSAVGAPPPGFIGVANRQQWSMIGTTTHQSEEHQFGISRRDREGQLHILGKSGSGKSKLLELLIREDITHGKGFALIDCHGDLTEEVLHAIPESRKDDFFLLDFADTTLPQAFNPFALARGVTRELFLENFLNFLSADVGDGAPTERDKRLLKHLLLIVVDQPDATLAELLQVLVDADLRRAFIAQNAEPSVREFFSLHCPDFDTLLKGDFFLQLQLQLSTLLATNFISDVLHQEQNIYDFAQIVREGKMFIARLPKQMLGSESTNFLGSLILSLIDTAAESLDTRKRTSEDLFYVYIDEFQNFASRSFIPQLSTASEKHLSYTLVHQTVGQIPEDVRALLTTKIQNFITFQLGGSDAGFMKNIFADQFSPTHLMQLDFRHFYTRLILNGQTVKPFSGRTLEVVQEEALTSHWGEMREYYRQRAARILQEKGRREAVR